jgi:hypothetical protein
MFAETLQETAETALRSHMYIKDSKGGIDPARNNFYSGFTEKA